VIADRLPVSEQEDVVVAMLPSSTPPSITDLRDKREGLQWSNRQK